MCLPRGHMASGSPPPLRSGVSMNIIPPARLSFFLIFSLAVTGVGVSTPFLCSILLILSCLREKRPPPHINVFFFWEPTSGLHSHLKEFSLILPLRVEKGSHLNFLLISARSPLVSACHRKQMLGLPRGKPPLLFFPDGYPRRSPRFCSFLSETPFLWPLESHRLRS